ncbi:MAG: tetratricopeptide repeat protein [Planctomycetes bacterium]|nr:tetratricopeptide repeat protein [Planctomycetota bacterium]
MRSTTPAAIAFLLVSCAGPGQEELPDGYLRAERSGLTVFYRPPDEGFVEELLPTLVTVRERARALGFQARLKSLTDSADLSGALDPDTGLGRHLLGELLALFPPEPEDAMKMEGLWRHLTQLLHGVAPHVLEFCSFERFRVVTPEDVRRGRVPQLAYDDTSGELVAKFTFQARPQAGGDLEVYLRSPTGTEHPVTELNLALPLLNGPVPAGASWLDPRNLLENGVLPPEAHPGEFSFVPTDLSQAAFLPLHEVAEVGLLLTLKIRDPLARWFHDGMANYLSHEVIRSVLSEEDYLTAPYSPRELGVYAADRDRVNLLAWPRAEIEKHKATEASLAHYYFSTAEIRGLAERHGRDLIPRLLSGLRECKPVTTEKILGAIEELTGEDFLLRLRAYRPVPTSSDPELESQATAYFQAGDFEAALPPLTALLSRDPRNVARRYDLAVSLLNVDAQKYREDHIFNYRIYFELDRAAGNEPAAPFLVRESVFNAPACHTMGTAFEELGLSESAQECYRKALELDPNHMPSQERCRALEMGGRTGSPPRP